MRRLHPSCAALACAVSVCVPVDAASAATFTAACSGTTGDPVSLVAAINSANAAGGANVVRLGAGCTYTLTALTTTGMARTVCRRSRATSRSKGTGRRSSAARRRGRRHFRLFFVGADFASPDTTNYVSPGAGRLTLQNLTLSGGLAQGGNSLTGGGGAGMGGAIFSQGTVIIDGSTLAGNTAQGGASGTGPGDGGGGIGTNSASGIAGAGGGFGAGSFGGGGGGSGDINGSGGGGAGFGTAEGGSSATSAAAGAGGGPLNGMGGAGGHGTTTAGAGGDGSGGGGGAPGDGSTGGGFGQGGNAAGGGGVGGGGGAGDFVNPDAGGGGGFGGGGGGATDAGGAGGFGGGGGSAAFAAAGASGGGPGGFGGGSGIVSIGAHGGGGAGMGGAIFNMQGQLTIENSTLAANRAIAGADAVPVHASGLGGAVFNLNGTFTAVDSTIAANTATTDGGSAYNLVYDAATARTAQSTLKDTIVAYGPGLQADLVSIKPANVSGAANNAGAVATAHVSQFDLVQTMATREAGTITGTPLTGDPLLGPLQDNGGPAHTMALMPGSPAIDAGSSSGLGTDQRGDPRPLDFSGIPNAADGDGGDIGAFEVQKACGTQASPSEACHTLTVSLAGTGAGTVSGPGIACPGSCAGSYGASTSVTLTATAAAGSMFAGWGGACGGTGACTVAMSADQTVTAAFTPTATPTSSSSPKPPSISSLKQSVSTWREGDKLARINAHRKPPVGTTFSFDLDRPATVTFTFTQPAAGRKVSGKCIAQTNHNKHKPRCTLIRVAGRLTLSAHQGINHVLFQGRVSRTQKLKPGRYTLVVIATANGKTSPPSTLNFTIAAR